MTLLARTYKDGVNILIGDIFFSSREKNLNFNSPTLIAKPSTVIRKPDSSSEFRHPFGLFRKLYIINDQLCVGLGGGSDKMYSFLTALEEFYSHESTVQDIQDFVKYYDKEKLEDFYATIGMIFFENNMSKHASLQIGNGWRDSNTEHRQLGKISVNGSGTSDFIRIIGTGKANLHLKNATEILLSNIDLISTFIWDEAFNQKYSSNYWGSGFELIYIQDNKFKFLDQVSFVVIKCKFNKKNIFELEGVLSLMKYEYQNDNLLIQVINTNVQTKPIIFVIPPINKKVVKESLSRVTFNAEYLSLLVLYSDEVGELKHLGIQVTNNDKCTIQEDRDSGEIEIKIDSTFLEDVGKNLR